VTATPGDEAAIRADIERVRGLITFYYHLDKHGPYPGLEAFDRLVAALTAAQREHDEATSRETVALEVLGTKASELEAAEAQVESLRAALERIALGLNGRAKDPLPNELTGVGSMLKPDWQLADEALAALRVDPEAPRGRAMSNPRQRTLEFAALPDDTSIWVEEKWAREIVAERDSLHVRLAAAEERADREYRRMTGVRRRLHEAQEALGEAAAALADAGARGAAEAALRALDRSRGAR